MQFLRQVRQRLLSENATGKLIVYGIAEIIIVVIGILIAVSIDNWNESKKNRAQEIVILGNIKQDLISDTLDMAVAITLFDSVYKEENKLLEFLYTDDLVPKTPIHYNTALFSPTFFALHQSSFINLQNNDPMLLSNNAIRKKLSRFYDYFVQQVLIIENEMDEMDSYSLKLPYFLKYFMAMNKNDVSIYNDVNSEEYFNPVLIRNELQIRDIEGLKKDEEFKIVLSESSSFTQARLQTYNNYMVQTRDLIKAIDLEVEELSK